MRKYTNLILEQLDEGLLTSDFVVKELLANYLSEAEVENFYHDHLSEIVDPYNDDEDDDYDGQPTEAEEWHSFDPDC